MIMVPAHNEEAVIEKTLAYLLHQLSYENYEVLVVNDGSTDDTPQILAELARKEARLRVITIEKTKEKRMLLMLALLLHKVNIF